ncbi:unnamed protein product [Diatraea saccharalis]|uniref:DRBM domain-containing protein n=1 Tax=Diatraea saccharalis TaxID=40085 RepID=A0A9P0FZ18_9NEOP|nr:unnamed protein product [Diatraea saccharalis]
MLKVIYIKSTALSKRQASEKAATIALHWLYINKRINSDGCPVYDKTVLDNLHNKINIPIEASLSDNSVDRIERIWNDYNIGIKPIYEETFKAAAMKDITSAALIKDSSLDEGKMYATKMKPIGYSTLFCIILVTVYFNLNKPQNKYFGKINTFYCLKINHNSNCFYAVRIFMTSL